MMVGWELHLWPGAVENCGRDGGGDSAAPSVNGTDALLESEAFDVF